MSLDMLYGLSNVSNCVDIDVDHASDSHLTKALTLYPSSDVFGTCVAHAL